jgi:prepilin-type N-terminal cleavage/methylation domain-containing protein
MTHKQLHKNQSGFTLIELLIVVGILAILLAITLLALNPSKHFQGARNAQRSSDVTAILDGVYEYEAAHTGSLPPSVTHVTTTAAKLATQVAAQSASATSFSTPDLTFTVPSGNIISSGSVTVTGCDQAGDNGTFPVTAGDDTSITVTDAGGSAISATGCSIGSWSLRADVCSDLVPTYLANLPKDPAGGVGTMCSGTYDSGYTLTQSTGNRFTVAAPSAEDGASISVTR